jgi:hypothetical protein
MAASLIALSVLSVRCLQSSIFLECQKEGKGNRQSERAKMNPSSRIRGKCKDTKKRQRAMRLRHRTDLALKVCTARPFPSLIGAFLITADLLSICRTNREWAIAFFDPTVVSATYGLRPRTEEQKWPALKCNGHSDVGILCSGCSCLLTDEPLPCHVLPQIHYHGLGSGFTTVHPLYRSLSVESKAEPTLFAVGAAGDGIIDRGSRSPDVLYLSSFGTGTYGISDDPQYRNLRYLNQGLSYPDESPFNYPAWRLEAFKNLWQKWALKGFVNVDFATDGRINRALGIGWCDPEGPLWKVNNDTTLDVVVRRIYVNLRGRLVIKMELGRPSPMNIVHAIRLLQWLEQTRVPTWIEEPRDPSLLPNPVRHAETIQPLEMRQFAQGSDGRFILTKENSPFIPHRTMFFSEFIMLEGATVRLLPGVVINYAIPIVMANNTSISSMPASEPIIQPTKWGNFSWTHSHPIVTAPNSFPTLARPPPPAMSPRPKHQICKNRPLHQPQARGKRRG